DGRGGGRHDHAQHHQRGPGCPGAEPVHQREADPDEVEGDGLPAGDREDRDEVEGENTAQPVSSTAGRNGQLSLTTIPPSPARRPAGPASAVAELVTLTAHRLDQAEAELGP